jgi:recombinational DNA repair protein (RecF pathway)
MALQEQGIILRTTPLRESDLLVVILGEQTGKITALARGAKNSKKRFMGGLGIFDCGTFELTSPKHGQEIYTLNGINERRIWIQLRKEFYKLSLASFCLELVDDFAPEGDQDSCLFFPMLVETLEKLNVEQDIHRGHLVVISLCLNILREGGFNILDHKNTIDTQLRELFQNLLKNNDDTQNVDPKIVGKALQFILGFIEHVVGHRLKTHQTVATEIASNLFRATVNQQ